MSEKLLPCPFCGNTNIMYFKNPDDGIIIVHCAECSNFKHSEIKYYTETQWNTRHYPPEVQAVIEAAKEYSERNEIFWYAEYEPEYKIIAAVLALEESEKK